MTRRGALVPCVTTGYGGAESAGDRRPIAPEEDVMKIRHRLFVGLVAAFAVSLASVSALAAETPFKGKVNAVETVVVVPPTLSVTRNDPGTAQQIGQFTENI